MKQFTALYLLNAVAYESQNFGDHIPKDTPH